ncbi:MAG: WD40 repeat domain-containing protein [Candidatus Bipolaricaulota bacterium]
MARLVCLLVLSVGMAVGGAASEGPQEIASLQLAKSFASSFSPDGSLLAVGAAREIHLLNTGDWTVEGSLVGHDGTVTDLAFSPDGTLIASSSWDETVRIWNVDTGEQIQTIGGYESWVRAVDFSPDGKLVAAGALEHRLRWGLLLVSDAATGRARMTSVAHEDWVRAVSFSPDGELLASGSDDRTIRVWDVGSRREVVVLDALAGSTTGRVYGARFSGDGRWLFAGVWGGVNVWETEGWSQVGSMTEHRGNVKGLAVLPGSQLVASGDDNGTMVVWEGATLEVLWMVAAHEESVRALSFHPNGQLLVSAGEDGTVKIWALPVEDDTD